MNYWWVNVGDTYKYVEKEKFLWAPKFSKDGTTPSHWKNLYDVKKDDIIFIYSKGLIRALGYVKEPYYESEKSFDVKHENTWELSGNRIDINLCVLDLSIPLYKINKTLQQLQELENSPLNKNAEVNQGYLYSLNDKSARYLLNIKKKFRIYDDSLKRTISEIKTKNSVISSIREYNMLGQNAFLDKYNFKRSSNYYLYYNNRIYDSKAILGVSYKYEYPSEEALYHQEFSGGNATVARQLKKLDFTIIKKSISTATYNALKIIAKPASIDEIKKVILENKLYNFTTHVTNDEICSQLDFYSINVNKKVKHNSKLFKRLDSSIYTLLEFTEQIENKDKDLNDLNIEYESQGEGTKKKLYTTTYERDPDLRTEAVRRHGVTCFACGFNFEEFYGEYAKDYIHIHHTKPLFEGNGKKRDGNIDELVPVCANCHSIIHRRKKETKSIKEIKKMINNQKALRF